MDEQNPRVDAERIGGRGDDRLTGRGTSGRVAAITDSTSARKPSRSSGTGAGRSMRQQETNPPAVDASADARTREIREDIEETREELSETVNAIQERLRPGTIVANAAESVKDVARDKARQVAESDSVQYVRANPIPTAMVGIGIAGLAWFAFAGRDRSSSRSAASWNTSDGTRRRYSADVDLYDGRGEDVRWGSSARQSGMKPMTDRTQETLRRTWNENPLVIGAACAVLGALAGLAIPETDRENRLMGETRDTLVESVQDTVREKVEKVQDVASTAVSTVQEAAAKVVTAEG